VIQVELLASFEPKRLARRASFCCYWLSSCGHCTPRYV